MLTMITSEWNSTLEQRYTYRHGSGGFAIGTTFGLLGIQRGIKCLINSLAPVFAGYFVCSTIYRSARFLASICIESLFAITPEFKRPNTVLS